MDTRPVMRPAALGDSDYIGKLRGRCKCGSTDPAGTENIYTAYAEGFKDRTHLDALLAEAEGIVISALNFSKGRE